MKKNKISIFILIWFVFIQFIYPVQTIIAIEKDELLSIKEIDTEKGLFELSINEAIDFDELKLQVPQNSQYDFYDTQYTYDNLNDKINISRENIKNNKIIFKIENNNDEEYEIIFNSYKNNLLIDKTNYKVVSKGLALQGLSDDIEKKTIQEEDVIKESENNISSPDLQRHIGVTPILNTVLSGNDAAYKISLKITGSQVYYTDVKLKIKLPKNDYSSFTQNLSDLKIRNVVPIYSAKDHSLNYDFDMLKSGQTYETVLKVNTTNGYMIHGEKLPVEAMLKFKENFNELNQTSIGIVTINASSSMSISKKMIKATHSGSDSLPTPNGNIRWEIKVSIPFKNSGQMFLRPDADIIIKDILPTGLTFRKDIKEDGTPLPDVKGNELIWKFKAPSIEEQEKNSDLLFEKTLYFWTQIENDKKYVDQTLSNKAELATTFIDDVFLNPGAETSSNVTIYASNPSSGNDTTTGTKEAPYRPTFYGPLDGSGNYPKGKNYNPNPVVPDTAYIRFYHDIFTYKYGVKDNFKSLEIINKFDKNLFLEKVTVPEDKWVSSYGSKAKVPLIPKPQYDMELYVSGKSKPIIVQDPIPGHTYEIEELGIDRGTYVNEIRLVFKGLIPKELGNSSMTSYYFSIKEGYVGEVKNTFDMVGESTLISPEGKYGGKYRRFNLRTDYPEFYDNTKSNVVGDRTAQIKPRNTFSTPISQITVDLLEHNKGEVKSGQNRLKVEYLNNASSQRSIEDPIESVVLLPPGVKVASVPNESFTNDIRMSSSGKYQLLEDNYNNSGRQLIKFSWDDKYIRNNRKMSAELDIDISDKAPSSLVFDVYGFSGNPSMKVPTTNNDVITNTVLQTDIEDLNNDGNKKSWRIKSANSYIMLGTYDLETEKFVKGPGEDWSKFAKTTPGGDIDYRLFLTNSTGKDISSMTLMDVLPAGGDLGLTDNIARGSKFMPYLKGPIELPKEWQGKVNVFYSTVKNPKRDDLIRQTDYPKDTQQLGNPSGSTDPKWMSESSVKDWTSIRSFKVELIPGTVWIKGVDMNITFRMEAPTVERASDKAIFDPKTDPRERVAWNSFAVATDNGQPVEPQQVGVYMNEDIGNLTINKIDSETKKTLSGAEFKISNKDGSFVKTIVSDDKGIAKLEDIPLGKYTIKETKAPDGYNLSSDIFEFEVTNDKYQHEFIIKNQKIKGKLTIKKVDSITGKVLSGAVFEVKNSKGEIITTLTTDDKGLADISDLLDDKYTITEVKAPEGYNILQKPIEFEITSKNSDITLTVKNTKTGWELPDTGGNGILLSSVVGLMFMSVGLSLIRLRRV
ncbi:MSCRAMM family protein [Vagococcus sp. JNUCC 83]